MNRLVVACLARNEAGRFWPSALGVWSEFADHIVVLDDGSTDATAALAEDAGAAVRVRGAGVSAWGTEAPARAELWDFALSESEPGDWLLVLDADMVPACDPRPLLHESVGSVAFRLYDLWAEDSEGALYYRCDGFWQAHRHPRTWLLRRPAEEPRGSFWQWGERGVHCGHLPANAPLGRTLIAPQEFSLLHYAYVAPALREAKAAAYESVAKQLTPSEQQHAVSILDPRPTLARLPFPNEYTLTIASPDDDSLQLY